MNTFQTDGIILGRLNYAERDRIVSVLTPHNGKLSLYVSGARSQKSKLAVAIELLTKSSLTIVKGKGDMYKLISGKVVTSYHQILTDYARLTTAYSFLKTINQYVYHNYEASYFYLLENSLAALNNLDILMNVVDYWFWVNLINLAGHKPNLITDHLQHKLAQCEKYNFDFDKMCFYADINGKYSINDIKFLRVVFSDISIDNFILINEYLKYINNTIGIIRHIRLNFLNIT